MTQNIIEQNKEKVAHGKWKLSITEAFQEYLYHAKEALLRTPPEVAKLLERLFEYENRLIISELNQGDIALFEKYYTVEHNHWQTPNYIRDGQSKVNINGVTIDLNWRYESKCASCRTHRRGGIDVLEEDSICTQCEKEREAIKSGLIWAGAGEDIDVFLRLFGDHWFVVVESEWGDKVVIGIAPSIKWRADCRRNKVLNIFELISAPKELWENAPWADGHEMYDPDDDED